MANKSFGLSNNSNVVTAYFSVSFSSPSISFGLSEKKATSDPETSADAANNTISIMIEVITGRKLKPPDKSATNRREIEFNF